MKIDELTKASGYINHFFNEAACKPTAKPTATTKSKKAGPAKPLKPVKPPKAFEYEGIDDDADDESVRD